MNGVVVEIEDGRERTFENNEAFEYNFKIEGKCAIVTRTAKKDANIVTDPYVLFADGAWQYAGYIE